MALAIPTSLAVARDFAGVRSIDDTSRAVPAA
jgi:hypothetical protein